MELEDQSLECFLFVDRETLEPDERDPRNLRFVTNENPEVVAGVKNRRCFLPDLFAHTQQRRFNEPISGAGPTILSFTCEAAVWPDRRHSQARHPHVFAPCEDVLVDPLPHIGRESLQQHKKPMRLAVDTFDKGRCKNMIVLGFG